MSALRRGLVWIGIGAYFAVALAWLGLSRPPAEPVYPSGSAFNTTPHGLSLARRYLATRAGGRVSILSRTADRDELPADAVVFRVRPSTVPPLTLGAGRHATPTLPALLAPGEEEWIRAGGRLVLALEGPYAGVKVTDVGQGRVEKAFPTWSGVTTLDPSPIRVLSGSPLNTAHAIFLSDARPVASRLVLGRGDLVVLACPEVLENGRLALADHLLLLEALAGASRPVFFDERVHGIATEAGMLELLGRWGLGPSSVLLGLTLAVAFWRARVRVGPEEADVVEARSDAVELLDSLAQLYDRSLRRDQALAQYRLGLGRVVAMRTGLRGPALETRLEAIAPRPPGPPGRSEREDLTPAEFASELRRLNDGYRRMRHVEPA